MVGSHHDAREVERFEINGMPREGQMFFEIA
jgi:hypothetical protein